VDTILYYANFGEELKQWSNVLGVTFNRNETNSPISGYTKMIYGDGTKLVGVSAYNVGHTPPVRVDDDLAWFKIPGTEPGTSPTSTMSSVGTKPATTSTTPGTTLVTTSGSPPATTSQSNPGNGSGGSQQWGQW
jgi:acetylxylan esterase